MEELSFKQIMFDIDTKVAEQILGKKYRVMYDQIESFFISNGFTHIEGSGYISNNKMTDIDLLYIIKDLKTLYPHLDKSIRDIRVGSFLELNSLNFLFSYDGTAGKYKRYNLPLQPKNTASNLLKRTVTIEEAAELLNNKIPFNAKKVDTKVLIFFDKSLKTKIDDVINKLHQKNNIKPKR